LSKLTERVSCRIISIWSARYFDTDAKESSGLSKTADTRFHFSNIFGGKCQAIKNKFSLFSFLL